MKKLLILVLALFCGQVWAQKVKPISSIKELVDSITTVVQQKKIPGLMLGITGRDSVLYAGGMGYADLIAHRRVDKQTLFRMGSITKSIVALAIMKLTEEGKLKLTDKLRDLAPEIPFHNPWESTDPVRVVNLLDHTTGFDDFKLNRMYSLARTDFDTKQMMLLQTPSMICRWRPSERFSYNNVNYAILGYLIAKRTGLSYDRYLTEAVMRPLGMVHSNFNLYSKYPLRDAKEYTMQDGKLQQVPSATFLIGPAGALWADSEDMVRLVQCFLGNTHGVIKQSSIEKMEQSQSSLSSRAGILGGYGAGIENFDGFRGHSGMLGTFRSCYRYNRELGLGFVVCSNGNGLASIENLITAFLSQGQSPKKGKTTTLDKKAIAPYLGYYQVENPRFKLLGFIDRLLLLKVEQRNDRLQFNMLVKKFKVLPTGQLTFTNSALNTPNIAFFRNKNKRVLVMNGRYCEQVSGAWALISRSILLISCLLVTLSFIPAFVTCVRKRKYSRQERLMSGLPVLATVCLAMAMLAFGTVYSSSHLLYKLATVTTSSVLIFAGTLFFGLLSVVNFVYSLSYFNASRNRFLSWYLLATALSLMIITVFLLSNGWLGLRTWAL
ncbi:serine hydrolase domain-containing protein [Spirosoma oryzicola]|uniref:serine hydrolase domain-containing protein n=1 Tax=Spirosoma oryzicola TaxID=2898794 RepID=UPI001E5A8989|nr:serine hydrolase domain-containing protein [Spirosoma oryzicola]UHG94762.1 beta-lactamase family protein [Spirosoma oryzicola]